MKTLDKDDAIGIAIIVLTIWVGIAILGELAKHRLVDPDLCDRGEWTERHPEDCVGDRQ